MLSDQDIAREIAELKPQKGETLLVSASKHRRVLRVLQQTREDLQGLVEAALAVKMRVNHGRYTATLDQTKEEGYVGSLAYTLKLKYGWTEGGEDA